MAEQPNDQGKDIKLPDPVPYEPPKENFADERQEEQRTYSEKKEKKKKKATKDSPKTQDNDHEPEKEQSEGKRKKKTKNRKLTIIVILAVIFVVLIAVVAVLMTTGFFGKSSGKTMATDDANLIAGGLVATDGTNTYISLSDGIYIWNSEDEQTLLISADEGVQYQDLAILNGTLYGVRERTEDSGIKYDLVVIDTASAVVSAEMTGCASLSIISLYDDCLYFLKDESMYVIDADGQITQTNLWHALLVTEYGIYTPDGIDGETFLGLRLVSEEGEITYVYDTLSDYQVDVLGEYEGILYIAYGDPDDEEGMMTLAKIDLETNDVSNLTIVGTTQAAGFQLNFYGDELYIASYLEDTSSGLQCSVYAYNPDSGEVTTLQERSEGILFGYSDAQIEEPRIYITDYYAYIIHPNVTERTIDTIQVVELD